MDAVVEASNAVTEYIRRVPSAIARWNDIEDVVKGTCTRTLVKDLYQVRVALHLSGRALSILVMKEKPRLSSKICDWGKNLVCLIDTYLIIILLCILDRTSSA